MDRSNPVVLVVDDDEQIRQLIARLLRPMVHTILEAGSDARIQGLSHIPVP